MATDETLTPKDAMPKSHDPSQLLRDAPAFDFYPERWTHGTRHLSKLERSDYLDLLCHQWTNDGLPADLGLMARILGYRRADQIPALVLEKFPVAEDGKRRNRRLEVERRKQRERRMKKARGAAMTNGKRWGTAGCEAEPGWDPGVSTHDGTAAALAGLLPERGEAEQEVLRNVVTVLPQRVARESLSDPAPIAERSVSESPPFTSHPSPPEGTPGCGSQGYQAPVPAPALEAVLAWAEAVMAPRECAEVFWHEHEARGWSDKNGQFIANARAAFNAYATRWKSVVAWRRQLIARRRGPRHGAYDQTTAVPGGVDPSQF